MTVEVVDLNGGPGIVFSDAGKVIATLTLDLDEHGRVAAIHNVANPDKLHAVATRTVHEIGR
jgi:RNA polymerase sigma-70 factor (ECF subfamily)